MCRWLNGELAALAKVADLGRAATSLARFISALRAVDSAGGPVHEFRGVSLAAHDHNTRTAAAILRGQIDVDSALVDSALAVWDAALAVPAWTGQPLWIHGDLHPANLFEDAAGRCSSG